MKKYLLILIVIALAIFIFLNNKKEPVSDQILESPLNNGSVVNEDNNIQNSPELTGGIVKGKIEQWKKGTIREISLQGKWPLDIVLWSASCVENSHNCIFPTSYKIADNISGTNFYSWRVGEVIVTEENKEYLVDNMAPAGRYYIVIYDADSSSYPSVGAFEITDN